ncbi:TRAP transporter, DctM subunit [Tranquillimonas rosea]|uniref:TRAP transporter, DctM subunit n=1 Tax=Tranquillimonas rosea TaxID=641238 RepID=A0A1H9UZ42_9RHOB|nr:TRAP transporter large permease subunit [Tranquillimonas rosea]SES14682.1 TRAP transporter, DctM subunit [Tranquillimonas rosea]
MEIFFLVLLIVIMAGALGSGYPVAFSLPGAAILTVLLAAGAGWLFAGSTDAFFASGGPSQWLSAGVTNLRGVYWEPERDTLIAIPLFIFMGIMLQRSKIAEDLLVTMAQLFGPVPGGLGISVVLVGTLLAATTGIVGATVVAMGLISLPAMMRSGYSNALASGTIAASGTLGQIIPPSIVLIILADQLASATDQADQARQALFKEVTGEFSMPTEFAVTSTSAGEMFLGALAPGLVLVGLYILFILGLALIRPRLAPAVPYEGRYDAKFLGDVLLAMVPPLALILLVLGSIIMGVATVNQAGAIGAVGAMVMAGYRLHPGGPLRFVPALMAIAALALIVVVVANYDTNVRNIQSEADAFGVTLAAIGVAVLLVSIVWSGWRTFRQDDALTGTMVETAKTTSLVFIILLGAAMLTAAFRAFGGEELVREFLNGLPGGFWSKFVIVMAVIFVLGFFLDFIEIAVVVVPIVTPILLADPAANVTAVWLGVMIGLNIQTSFLTPPFGFALFYLRGVAPAAVRTIQIYRGVVAFIGLQLIALLIVAFNPPLVNYLPNRTSLLAETAPPPVNPALQFCMEDYVAETFDERGDDIRAAIDRAASLDLSYLPEDLRDEFADGIEAARESFTLMDEIRAAEEAVAAAAPEYRPQHTMVRDLQSEVRGLSERIEELETRIRRGFGDTEAQEATLEQLQSEREAIQSQIPEGWDDVHAEFATLTDEERRARLTYRRTVDDAYEPVPRLQAIIADADALAALEDEVAGLQDADLEAMDGETADQRFGEVESRVGEVAGADDIRGLLADARRDIDDREPDPAAARESVDEAVQLLRSEVEWRNRAADELAPALAEYERAIRTTIGLRSLPRLPREQALEIAACKSDHRDISLNF